MTATAHSGVDLTMARVIAQLWRPERPVQNPVPQSPEQTVVQGLDHVAIDHFIGACLRNKVPLLSLPTTMAMDNPTEYEPADTTHDTGQGRQYGQIAVQGCHPAPDGAPAPWGTTLAIDALFRQAVEAERADWCNTRREYLLVEKAFQSEGIRAVLIKSVGLHPSLPYRSDNLDVLIDPRHDQRARQILLDLRYIEVTNVEEPLKFLFRKFHLGESISAIHLHESVGWGTGFMDDAAVLADARPAPDDPQLWIPSPEDAMLITMAHAFYEDKEIKLGDLWKAIHLLRENRLDWDRVERQAAGRGWADGLDTCILLWSSLEERIYGDHSFPAHVVESAGQHVPAASRRYLERRTAAEPEFPFAVSFRFSKRLYYGKVLRDPALKARQKAIDITRHTLAGFKRRLPTKTQPAMLIALSGIDGSGKTVHAQALCKALQQCEVDARVVWMRGGSSPLADRVIGLVKPWLTRGQKYADRQDRSVEDTAPSLAERHDPLPPQGGVPETPDILGDTRQAKVARKSAWLRRPLLRAGWISLVTFDLMLTCTKQVWWPLARGRVVICDRYVYDALVEMAALADDEHVLDGWAARLLRALCPRPQQAYLLDVSPQHAMVRKPDELEGFLAQQSSFYHMAAAAWGLQILDTNSDQGTSTDDLVHRVLREYYRDWHTAVAAIFWANPLKHDTGN